MAELKLTVFAPWEDIYKYMWDGKERTGTTFKCLLVDSVDPTCYCHAECKKTKKSATAYEAAKAKYKDGATFMFSKTAFVEDARAAYLSAPKREVIDLLESTAFRRRHVPYSLARVVLSLISCNTANASISQLL